MEKRHLTAMSKMLKEHGAKKVFVQLPPGLKHAIKNVSDFLKARGYECVVSIENCYGACDLRINEAKALGCDVILHVGHRDFGVRSEIPVIYYEYQIDVNVSEHVKNALSKLNGYKKIGVVSTVNFESAAKRALKLLERHGKKAIYCGYILGCRVDKALRYEKGVDCFLFIGSGRFHPLGLSEASNKPVIAIDVETGKVWNASNEAERKRRVVEFNLSRLWEMGSFGILISTKPGQLNLELAEKVKKMLEERGKSAYILVFDELTKEKLEWLDIDCFINTACPRIEDDYEVYGKPLINAGRVINYLNNEFT